MESTSESNGQNIDPTVGGLVWVRRRNGSWWPGRIVGVDELSEGCLVSPKLGTPVKLLGRDDASVDWYNLEKSKRVKAFRCGDYDECIEKAKAAAANSSRKKVKYARREDAIIHALELESAQLSKDRPDACSELDKSGGEECLVKESPTTSLSGKETEDMDEKSGSLEDDSNSAHEFSQSGVSFEEPNHVTASREQSAQGMRRRTPNDSEDDGTEGVKRMRGLEDLGMGGLSSLKRKRYEVAHVHEFLKRKNRRRPLTKVLETTAMVSVPIMCERLPSPSGSSLPIVSDNKVYGVESIESKRSLSVVLNNSDSTGASCENGISLIASGHASEASLINFKQKDNEISSTLGLPQNDSSDKLFDVPFVGEEKHPAGFSIVPCSSQKPQSGAVGQSSQSSQVETVSLGNEELLESGSTSSGAADIDSISKKSGKDSSKWQLKGKRNRRHANTNNRQDSRKSVDDDPNAYLAGLERGDVFSIDSDMKVDHDPRAVEESQHWGWNGNVFRKVPRTGGSTADVKLLPDCSHTTHRSLPYRQSRFTSTTYQTDDFLISPYGAYSSLYDVNLEVKASYRPQHVPYISLMSKLNGQAIIGHPLTVEVLDDGFCDLLVSGPECHLPSTSCDFNDDLGDNVSAFQGDMDYVVKPNRVNGRVPKKPFMWKSRVLPNKPPKTRKNGLVPKKIRKLSSLTGSHKRGEHEKKAMMDKLKGPAVACVPLKVVFSRINASFNGSMRPAHRTFEPAHRTLASGIL